MSNVNGKAYAMNLITPVYVKTSWLSVLFVPGVLITLKALSYFVPNLSLTIINGSGIGCILVIVGFLTVILGLARWIKIIDTLNEYVFWFMAAVSFGLAILTTMTIVSVIVYSIIGIILLVIGIILLKNGITWLNRLIFWLAGLSVFQKAAFGGLETLSLIHYARWVIVRDSDFPRLSPEQPKEDLRYGYMFFFSNFNGSWTQYVDSFSLAIPGGLNLLWSRNLGWKNAKVETPFNGYVQHNQIDTEHYYNAYPLASSNDVKSAKKVKSELLDLVALSSEASPEDFKSAFNKTITKLQSDLSQMEHTPIVSLAHEAIERRKSIQKNNS